MDALDSGLRSISGSDAGSKPIFLSLTDEQHVLDPRFATSKPSVATKSNLKYYTMKRSDHGKIIDKEGEIQPRFIDNNGEGQPGTTCEIELCI